MPQIDPKKNEHLKRKLSEYAAAEDRGVSLLTQMLEFVPGEEERKFIEGQVEDEKKHNRLFQQRADELNVEETFFLESLGKLYDLGQKCVSEGDWLKCITCQSIIEEVALASFASFFQRADEKTRKILLEIMDDEKRHLDFTFWQIRKWAVTKDAREKVFRFQELVLELFLDALKPENLAKQIPPDEQNDFKKVLTQTYKLHRQRFSRLKMEVPGIPMRYLAKIGL